MKTELVKKVISLIDQELRENCTDDVYPTLCRLKATPQGIETIHQSAIKIIAETGMSVGSALAQLESSL
jgi:hypothetical protein